MQSNTQNNTQSQPQADVKMDNVENYKRVIGSLSHNPERTPYTYHHDFIISHTNRFQFASRSKVAKLDTNEEELYACALAYILEGASVMELLRLDEVDSHIAMDAMNSALVLCEKIDQED